MLDELQQISNAIWIFPRNGRQFEANVGIIRTPNRTILVDAGNSPRHARRIILALMECDAPPISHLIYTHHHWDHTFGGMMFEAPVIAHDSCYDLLKELSRKPWSQSFLRDEILKNPLLTDSYSAIDYVMSEWRSFHIHLPTMSFSNQLRLHIDGIELQLQHIGGQHASDSIVVCVPQEGVIFLGDCFYPPPAYLQANHTDSDDMLLKSLLADERFDTFIDGHSAPQTREQIRAWLKH